MDTLYSQINSEINMNVLKFCRLISKNFNITEPKELYKIMGRCSSQKKLQKTLSLKKKLIWKIMKKLILKIMNNFNNYRLLKFMIQVKEKTKTNKGTCH